MNCSNHPEISSFENCGLCLKPFCKECLTFVRDRFYCSLCSAQIKVSEPVLANPQNHCSPGTAFALGLIPGVGAICNGEYLKALVHVMVFGFLISLSHNPGVGNFESLFGMMVAAFYFYMPLEACHTARRNILKARGQWSQKEEEIRKNENLWAGMILVGIGCLLFLDELIQGFLEHALKFWPVVLLGLGGHKIWVYFGAGVTIGGKNEQA